MDTSTTNPSGSPTAAEMDRRRENIEIEAHCWRCQRFYQFVVCFFATIMWCLAAWVLGTSRRWSPRYFAGISNLVAGLCYSSIVFLLFSGDSDLFCGSPLRRPSIRYLLVHLSWVFLWAAQGPSMLLSRYRNDDEDKNGLEKRKGGRGGGGKGGKGMKSDPEDIATACAAFALICFFFYLCSTVYMCRLVYGRLVRSRADRKEMQQAGDASRVTAAGEDVC